MRPLVPLLSLLAMSALALSGCGDKGPTACACFVSVEDASITLGCGDSRCLGGTRWACDEDVVMALDTVCNPDLASPDEPGSCRAFQGSCSPSGSPCCTRQSDAGVLMVGCDPASLRCCVAAGGTCESSQDCCQGRTCAANVNGGPARCGL